jgi:hypothetical protein
VASRRPEAHRAPGRTLKSRMDLWLEFPWRRQRRQPQEHCSFARWVDFIEAGNPRPSDSAPFGLGGMLGEKPSGTLCRRSWPRGALAIRSDPAGILSVRHASYRRLSPVSFGCSL